MIPHPYELYVSEFALVDNLSQALGFEPCEAVGIVLQSKWVAPLIDNVLFGESPDLPDMCEHDDWTVLRLLEMDLAQLRQVSRVVAALSQSPNLLRSADGSFLRHVVDYAGVPGILESMNGFTPPDILNLPVLKMVDSQILEQVADQACSLLVGMFPDPYLQRFAFRFPPAELPTPIGLVEGSPDAIGFAAVVRKALLIIEGAKHAQTSAS